MTDLCFVNQTESENSQGCSLCQSSFIYTVLQSNFLPHSPLYSDSWGKWTNTCVVIISQLPRHRGFFTGEMRVIYKHTDTNKFCIMKEINSLRKDFWSSFNFTPGPSDTGPCDGRCSTVRWQRKWNEKQ